MGKPILSIVDLKKTFHSNWTFRPIEVLKGISLEIEQGESFGFLGPNGAGKTTTIKCILGLIKKTGGRILLDGEELTSSAKHRILGYLPENSYFYDHLTVEETLSFFASLHNMRNPERKRLVSSTLELVNLEKRRYDNVRSLSKGLQQRLGFAQAIINKPKLLLLDEPFSGLDPIGRREIRQLILELNQKGSTIFLSSHILADVEDICDRVSILFNGKIQTVFRLEESAELFGQSFELVIRNPTEDLEQEPLIRKPAYEVLSKETISGKTYTFHYANYSDARQAINKAISAGVEIERFRRAGRNLEEIFISITGRESSSNGHSSPRKVESLASMGKQNES